MYKDKPKKTSSKSKAGYKGAKKVAGGLGCIDGHQINSGAKGGKK